MRSMRQRFAAVTLLGGLTTLGLGLTAGPASAAPDLYCLPVLGDSPNGSLQITTTPAAGSEIEPGSDVAVEAAWDAADFEETDRLVVCMTVDGVFDEDLSSEHKSLDNDGEHSAAATVPADLAPGSEVCITGVVKGFFDGESSNLMVSDEHCFRVAAAATTTTTMAPTTTTTTEPEPVVEDEVVEAGAPAAPAVEVAPAVEPAPLPELPRTGAGIGLLAGVGGFSLALGGLTRFLGRRRNG